MGRERIEIGILGEELAGVFLGSKGYRVRCRNFRTPFGELDIVAQHRDSIVFIEVRTRTTSSLGPPFLSVTKLKQARIIKNALFYLARYGLTDKPWRIDIVSVKLSSSREPEKIELIENAVEDY